MSKLEVAAKRLGGFVKKNAFYILIGLCVAAVITVVTLAVLLNQAKAADVALDPSGITDVVDDKPTGGDEPVVNPGDNKPDTPVVVPLTFASPVSGAVANEFSDSVLVFNQTLDQWATHLGVDFAAEVGTKVTASASGVVKEVGYDELNGHYVVMTHEDGYQTCYYSLGEDVSVKVGQSVGKGSVIGSVGNSMQSEALQGAHLHFETFKNGVAINPLEVLILEEK